MSKSAIHCHFQLHTVSLPEGVTALKWDYTFCKWGYDYQFGSLLIGYKLAISMELYML